MGCYEMTNFKQSFLLLTIFSVENGNNMGKLGNN